MSQIYSSKIDIILKGQKLVLLAKRAIFWEEQKALLLADLHLGKTAHFQNNGISVPNSANSANLDRLNSIIDSYPVEKIYFLGDLFHSTINRSFQEFLSWRKQHKNISCELILGNHDIIDLDMYEQAKLRVSQDKIIPPFILQHEPATEEQQYYVLAGHTHPGVRLKGKGRQSQRLACFYFNKVGGTLPAFGNFTGLHLIKGENEDLIFPIVKDSILDINNVASNNQVLL